VTTNEDQYKALLQAMLNATRAGSVVWTPGDGRQQNEQAYSFHGQSGGALIFPIDWDGLPPYKLQILDINDSVVKEFVSADLEDDGSNMGEMIRLLYVSASESISSSVASALLRELNAQIPSPPPQASYDDDEEPF
jgi:hypothetical protein